MERLVRHATRAPDPDWQVSGGRWLVRRLAPDCSRIELVDLPGQRDEAKLLHAMGAETANLHLATPGAAAAIARDLGRRPAGWLTAAAIAMAADVRSDATAWVAASPHEHAVTG
jgi:hypothetical protein